MLDVERMKAEGASKAEMDIMERFYTTIHRHAERAVVTPGAGDIPMWMTHPYGGLIGQFKAFPMASMNRTTIPMFQAASMGHAAAIAGIPGMVFLGSALYVARQKMYGREYSDDPRVLLYEGLLRSGVGSILTDGMAMSQDTTANWFGLGKVLGIEMPSRYYARGFMSDLFGPSFGTIQDAATAFNSLAGLPAGQELSDQDMVRLWRMLPGQNLFYIRALLENW